MTTSEHLLRPPVTTAAAPPRPDRRKLLGLALCLVSATGFGFLGPGARIAYDAGATVGLTILLFGVQPSGWQWLGMALVLGGVALQAVPAPE
jgi:drug/metabolite transporter (DMT)-like permease